MFLTFTVRKSTSPFTEIFFLNFFYWFNQWPQLGVFFSVFLVTSCRYFLVVLLNRRLHELYLFLGNAAWPHRFGQNNEHSFKGQLREKGFAQHIFTIDVTSFLSLSFFLFLKDLLQERKTATSNHTCNGHRDINTQHLGFSGQWQQVH